VSKTEIAALIAMTRKRAEGLGRPYVIGIDGPSGAGKSTLAVRLADALGGCVLEGDDFFAGGVSLRRDTAEERVRDCIDWRRQRPVLEALRAGRTASYFAFDWEVFDGRLEAEPRCLAPRPFVVFEGVYSTRPELRDLMDLRVLLRVKDEIRNARLLAREGTIGPWERQWHEAEDWYFTNLAPPGGFDVVLE
jgi:uridine kinase